MRWSARRPGRGAAARAVQGALLALGAAAAARAQEVQVQLTLLHINDVHSRIEEQNKYDSACSPEDSAAGKCFGGMARVAAQIKAEVAAAEAAGRLPLVLDAGDQLMGTMWSTFYTGDAAVEFQKRAGVQVMAVGNHEFDYGPDNLVRYINAVGGAFPVLSANMDAHGNADLAALVKPYHLVTAQASDGSSVQVGIIGMTTPRTEYTSNTQGQVKFADVKETYEKYIQELRGQGARVIIGLSHCGYDVDQQVAQEVEGLDVVVGAHTHTFLYDGPDTPLIRTDKPDSGETAYGAYPTLVNDGKTAVVQARCYSRYLGKLEATFAWRDATFQERLSPTFSGNPVLLGGAMSANEVTPDPDVAAKVTEMAANLGVFRTQKVGQARLPLIGGKPYARVKEISMGNVMAHILVKYAKDTGLESQAGPIDIALLNGGGVRASMSQGDVTVEDAYTVFPFSNTASVVAISGQKLLDALEHGVRLVEEWEGSFLQTEGCRYVINTDEAAGSRLKKALCRKDGVWQPVDPGATYNVVINDYMLSGGDGFSMFKEARTVLASGEEIASLLMTQFQEYNQLGLTIDGRILDCGMGKPDQGLPPRNQWGCSSEHATTGWGAKLCGHTCADPTGFKEEAHTVSGTLFVGNYLESEVDDAMLQKLRKGVAVTVGVAEADVEVGKATGAVSPDPLHPTHVEAGVEEGDEMYRNATLGVIGVMVPFMVHTGSREVADAVYGDLYQAVYQQSYFKAEMQRASYIRVNQLGVADLKVESCVDIGTCVFPAGAEEGEKKGNINRTVAIVVPVMLVLVLLAGFFAWRYHRLRRNTQMKLRMLSNMQSVNASPGQFQANNELFAMHNKL